MKTVDFNSNFFEIFGLPLTFEIDTTLLADRFRSLQSAIHPDKFANASDLERRLSVQKSAQINEAFQTLKHPLSRARYLLLIKGIDLSMDTDTKMDAGFLMEQIGLRERLDAAKSAADPAAELAVLSEAITEKFSRLQSELTRQFEISDAQALLAARDTVRKMQFLDKLHQEVMQLEEEILQ